MGCESRTAAAKLATVNKLWRARVLRFFSEELIEYDCNGIQAINRMLDSRGHPRFPFKVEIVTLPRGVAGEVMPERAPSLSDLDGIDLLDITSGRPMTHKRVPGCRDQGSVDRRPCIKPQRGPACSVWQSLQTSSR
jgi:hypothetical protein